MRMKTIAGLVAGGLALGLASAAWAAGAPQPKLTRVALAQPNPSGAADMPPGDLPPPARPKPARKSKFFAGPGLGLLLAGAGAGTAAVVAGGDDDNPASP